MSLLWTAMGDRPLLQKKKMVQLAYKQRVGKQQKEVRTEADLEGLIVGMKDDLDLVKKELKEVKDDGD